MSAVSLGYVQTKKLLLPFIIGDLVFDYVTNLNCFLFFLFFSISIVF